MNDTRWPRLDDDWRVWLFVWMDASGNDYHLRNTDPFRSPAYSA